MRRIALWFSGTAVLVVLLFTYRTSTSGATATSPAAAGYAPGVIAGPPAGSAGSAGGTDATVVNGSVAQTRWGPVQVQVHVSGGKIADVTVLQQPSGNRRDVEINSSALPQLRQQVLQAQSADINGVSGATVTSDGYRESLRAALALVHIG